MKLGLRQHLVVDDWLRQIADRIRSEEQIRQLVLNVVACIGPRDHQLIGARAPDRDLGNFAAFAPRESKFTAYFFTAFVQFHAHDDFVVLARIHPTREHFIAPEIDDIYVVHTAFDVRESTVFRVVSEVTKAWASLSFRLPYAKNTSSGFWATPKPARDTATSGNQSSFANCVARVVDGLVAQMASTRFFGFGSLPCFFLALPPVGSGSSCSINEASETYVSHARPLFFGPRIGRSSLKLSSQPRIPVDDTRAPDSPNDSRTPTLGRHTGAMATRRRSLLGGRPPLAPGHRIARARSADPSQIWAYRRAPRTRRRGTPSARGPKVGRRTARCRSRNLRCRLRFFAGTDARRSPTSRSS